MLNRLKRRLARENGESDPVLLVISSVVFLIVSLGVGAIFTMSLGESGKAQTNTEITQALEAHLLEVSSLSYTELTTQKPVTAEPNLIKLKFGSSGKTINAYHQTRTIPKSNSLTYTVSVPRQVSAWKPYPDCKNAFTRVVKNCLTLSVSVTPTVYEKAPLTPEGFTLKKSAAPRGMFLGEVDSNALVSNGRLDFRLSMLPTYPIAPDLSTWRVSMMCPNDVALPGAESTFKSTPNSQWIVARISVTKEQYTMIAATCEKPNLVVWSTGVQQPTTSSITNAVAWRVSTTKAN